MRKPAKTLGDRDNWLGNAVRSRIKLTAGETRMVQEGVFNTVNR